MSRYIYISEEYYGPEGVALVGSSWTILCTVYTAGLGSSLSGLVNGLPSTQARISLAKVMLIMIHGMPAHGRRPFLLIRTCHCMLRILRID
jgi:hypothetical protein